MRASTVRCGTISGAQRHYRLKELICEPCRLARNAYMLERNRKLGVAPRTSTLQHPVLLTVPAGKHHGVYVLFAAKDEVLYIGRTQNVRVRVRAHLSQQPWGDRISRIEWTPCGSVHEAREVEKSMIRTFRPASNINDVEELMPSPKQMLPDWVGQKLVAMYEDVVAAGKQSAVAESEFLNGYILALRNKGWYLAAIAYPLGMTRESIRLRQKAATFAYDKPGVPSPPAKAVKVKAERPRVPDNELPRLRGLAAQARTVRGWTPLDAPEREASERYSELLAGYVLQGVAIGRLAKQLGVTHLAIRARLARHGYMDEVKGLPQPKYGTPFLRQEQRAECKAGHPLSGDNLYLVGGDPKKRFCKACGARRAREYYQRKKASA